MVTAPALRRPLLALVAVLALTTAACSASGSSDSSPSTTKADGTTTTEATSTTRDGGDPTTTTDPDEPDPDPGEVPKVGDCWEALTGEETDAVSFPGEQVDCDEEHGGETVAVEELPEDLAADIDPEILDGDPADPDVSAPVQATADVCRPAWAEILQPLALTVGGDILNTAERATKVRQSFWLPTGDEWEAGARWVRCDLSTSDGTTFTSPVETLKSKKVPADLVLCLAKSIGTGQTTDCSSSEATWQVSATFSIKRTAGPTDTVAYRTLLEKTLPPQCQILTTQAVGDVGDRVFRIFTQSSFDESTGDFQCAVRVTGPVDKPFGT